ncbi:E3 SUMO-protein ligase ZBED1-like isoform X1 [Nothobranchius furzeri]|uniref:DUF659 domain-containing protein n=1 Tax=Nothobranchius furzeri TaxID=105023 RepID=A0A8C6NLG6_NOTFU
MRKLIRQSTNLMQFAKSAKPKKKISQQHHKHEAAPCTLSPGNRECTSGHARQTEDHPGFFTSVCLLFCLLEPTTTHGLPPPPAEHDRLSPSYQKTQKVRSITKAIATFIATDLRTYSVVNNGGFRLVVRTMELRYKLPHRKYFAEKEVPRLYEETKASVLESMKKPTRIVLTCDAWTSVATKSFVTVTAHFVLASDKNGWKLVSHVLQTREMSESHTGANVGELLEKATAEWQISDKDLVLVTDNASNMVVADQKTKYVHLKCYAHTANLASQKALKLAAVAKLLARIRQISTFFHRSTTRLHLLEENQKLLGLKQHKLKTDVCTRWNSAYKMTERFLEQQPAIAATLLSPQVGETSLSVTLIHFLYGSK